MMRLLVLRVLQVLLAPVLVACALERRFGHGERVFAGCGELLALVPGWPGSMVRKAFYLATLSACADRAYIGFGTMIVHRGASVGRDVYIGPYSIIGTARIGEGVKIASRVSILSGRHQHDPAAGAEAMALPTYSEVSIGAGAWIGEGAIVMANVGCGAVVGAGSVVVRDVPDGATVVGNPARQTGSSGNERLDRPAVGGIGGIRSAIR
jgi:acetyltransferase-like isoleucine patch superfamily enzyme